MRIFHLFCFLSLISRIQAFLAPARPRSFSRFVEKKMVTDFDMGSSSFLTAVEIFDGSTVDPVVVSNVFWASLKGKIIAIIVGQLLATLAFGLLSSFLAAQLAQLGDFISKQFPSKPSADGPTDQKPFIKASSTTTTTISPDFGKLIICLAIDVIGSSSELIPILGEATDIVYAPIAGAILRSLYGSNLLFVLEFTEEILPFTDFLPLATICWVVDTFFGESDTARLLQLGVYNPTIQNMDAIDTTAVDTTTTKRLPEGENSQKR